MKKKDLLYKRGDYLKNKIILITLFFSVFILGACEKRENTEIKEVSNTESIIEKEYLVYDEIVKEFKVINSEKLMNKDLEVPSFIYVGRKSCPSCREFVPFLKHLAETNFLDIKYLDTEVLSKEIKSELVKSYNIESVPTLLYLDENRNIEKYDSDVQENLKDWLSKKI